MTIAADLLSLGIVRETVAEHAAAVSVVNPFYLPGDVRRYGALGNATADDSAAFARAALLPYPIFVPWAIHIVSAATVCALAKTKVMGEGRGSIIRATAATFNVFEVRANDVTFENVAIEGAASGTSTTQYGIFTAQAYAPTRLSVLNCYFGGNAASTRLNNGVKFDDDCDYGIVSGCIFDEMQGTVSGTGYGVLLGASFYSRIVRNLALGASGRGRHAFYLSAGASYCHVTDNIALSQTFAGITVNATNLQTACAYNIIERNLVVDAVTGDEATDAAISVFGKATGQRIADNIIISSNQMGISINARDGAATDCNCLDNVIYGNQVYASGTRGIEVAGGTRTRIIGNAVHDSSQNASDVSANIRLVATASSGQAANDTTLIGNVCTGTTQRSSLDINATSPVPSGTFVQANRFATGVTTDIENSGSVELAGNSKGTFTGSLTGCTTVPTGALDWSLEGDVVTLEIPAIAATSNTTAATITGMPAGIRPVAAQSLIGITQDNGVTAIAKVIVETSGVITLHVGVSATFTGSGTKGVGACTISYRRS